MPLSEIYLLPHRLVAVLLVDSVGSPLTRFSSSYFQNGFLLLSSLTARTQLNSQFVDDRLFSMFSFSLFFLKIVLKFDFDSHDGRMTSRIRFPFHLQIVNFAFFFSFASGDSRRNGLFSFSFFFYFRRRYSTQRIIQFSLFICLISPAEILDATARFFFSLFFFHSAVPFFYLLKKIKLPIIASKSSWT